MQIDGTFGSFQSLSPMYCIPIIWKLGCFLLLARVILHFPSEIVIKSHATVARALSKWWFFCGDHGATEPWGVSSEAHSLYVSWCKEVKDEALTGDLIHTFEGRQMSFSTLVSSCLAPFLPWPTCVDHFQY